MYPIQVVIPEQESYNRGFAFPLLGGLVRFILLIPHIIVLYILLIIVYLLQYILWIPVLFTGRYPSWGRDIVGGYVRWSARIQCYFLGLTDQYPPFQLGSGS